jgi:hypothetical protein
VEQFHLLDLNWNWHSSMALAAPTRTDSMKVGFFLQNVIWEEEEKDILVISLNFHNCQTSLKPL